MARKSETQVFLEDTYKFRNPTGHWFDVDTMNFFKSKIHPELHLDEKTIYFIESKKPPYGPRQYTIKRMDDNGEVHEAFDGKSSYKACKVRFKEMF